MITWQYKPTYPSTYMEIVRSEIEDPNEGIMQELNKLKSYNMRSPISKYPMILTHSTCSKQCGTGNREPGILPIVKAAMSRPRAS
jgi:hypothetical protein